MRELYDKAFLRSITDNPNINTEDTYDNPTVFKLVRQMDYKAVYRLEYLENLEQIQIIVRLKDLFNDPVIKDAIARHLSSYILFLRTVEVDNELIKAVQAFRDSMESIQYIMDIALKYRNCADPDLFTVLKDLSKL